MRKARFDFQGEGLIMLPRLTMTFALLTIAVPANAQADLESGLAGAVRGCEEWVLNPASWSEGIGPFVATVGLGSQMSLVETVGEEALPPQEMRAANHYWRINSTENAGYILVVSDQLPICHITGGGGSDLQPVVETVLASEDFLARWAESDESSRGDMLTTEFRNREEPAFSIVISRAQEAGQRLDRVQVLASAMFELAD